MSPFINKSENYTASHISVYLGKCLNQPFNQWVLWYITKFRYKLYYSKHFWHYRRTYNLGPDCITMKKDNIYSWLNIINVSLTTKFLPFPVYCFVSVFSCCSPWCQSNFLCWLRYVLCFHVLSMKGMQLALVVGTMDVSCLSLIIVDFNCWMLLVLLWYFEESLGTNSVCSAMVLSAVLLVIIFLFLIVSSRLS